MKVETIKVYDEDEDLIHISNASDWNIIPVVGDYLHAEELDQSNEWSCEVFQITERIFDFANKTLALSTKMG